MNLIKRAGASIRARVIQPWKLKNYEKISSGKALAAYKNKYEGRRCFLIGNGPSLRAEDLTKLHEAGVITFGFNRIYNIFDQTPWRPTFYISQDEKMLGGCMETVNKTDMGHKLIPIELKWWHGIRIDHALHFHLVHQEAENPLDFGFSDDITKGIFNSSTCMYTAAQIAVYMGFSEICLIGVDHSFRISQNNQGQIIVDENARDYFSDKYNADRENLYIPNTEKSTLTYLAMKHHCDTRGVRVFNATRGGKLEVFPRVDFDSLF